MPRIPLCLLVALVALLGTAASCGSSQHKDYRIPADSPLSTFEPGAAEDEDDFDLDLDDDGDAAEEPSGDEPTPESPSPADETSTPERG